jgi:hypothetical protein
MGQYGNQPDFITEVLYEGSGDDNINSSTFLNGALIYVGDTANGDVVKAIPVGRTRDGQVTGTNITEGGAGYTAGTGVATTNGSGTGLTVDTTVVAGEITAIAINNAGKGYKIGDVVRVNGGTTGCDFTVNAISNLPTAQEAIQCFGCQEGIVLPFVVDYILATGTTAGKLVAGK